MAGDMWQIIHTERNALTEDLQALSPAEWIAPSLCSAWTVQQVLGHLTATAMMTPPAFLSGFARAGFNFDKFTNRNIEAQLGASPEETLQQFRAAASRTTSPPGPAASWVGETIVHAEDIRRPLGIAHTYDLSGLRQIADFYPRSNLLIGAKSRVAGLRLEATDTDWSTGSGPTVRGPLLALVMTMTGRSAFLNQLDGDGLSKLRSG